MPTIPIGDPGPFTIPPSTGFVPDRLGVWRAVIDVDRDTNAYRTSLTPCPANAVAWGPSDAAEVSTPDLVAEILAATDSAAKAEAIAAVQRIGVDLLTVAAFVLSLRE